MEGDVSRLKEQIVRAFSPVPHPAPDRINPYPCCDDHDRMTEWYREHTCEEFLRELGTGTLDAEFMPYEQEGFVYFLPAVLLYTLDCFAARGEAIWESSVTSGIGCSPVSNWIEVLIPLWDDQSRARYAAIKETLTQPQLQAVRDYLSFFRDVSPADEERFREDIQRTLIETW
jgi:hypothetical protein